MKTTSYRVRPVMRFNLTYGHSDPDTGSGGAGSVAIFENQETAEQVGRALAAQIPGAKFSPMDGSDETSPYMQYVIVERGFDPDTKAYYAEYPAQAEQYRQQLEAHYGRDFRVFSRPVDGRGPAPESWPPLDLS